MDLVPVIDLMDGEVVHARAGNRSAYQPLHSPLSPSADPLRVAAALLGLHPFRRLYIADLDAIMGAGSNKDTIKQIGRRYPDLELWVDCGLRNGSDMQQFLDSGLGTAVIGSETLRDTGALAVSDSVVLSLDYRNDRLLGDTELERITHLWPRRVVALSLSRVGVNEGPDMRLLGELRKRSPGTRIYAGGGIRDLRDLHKLAASGINGALLATALHSGALGTADLCSAKSRFQE